MAKTDSVLSQIIATNGNQAAEDLIFDAFSIGGSLSEAAKQLGVSQGTLGYFMRMLGLKVITTRALVKIETSYLPKEAEASNG